MVKNHLSRLNAPNSWPIRKKGIKFITRPTPGAHTLQTSIPLSIVLIKILKVARIGKEVKRILHNGNILVNNKIIRSDKRHSLGIMDVISIPTLEKEFILVYDDKGKFAAVDLEKNKGTRLLKIANKTTLKGSKLQLQFTDGSNLFIAKDTYKTGDTIVFDMKDKKIVTHLPFEKKAKIYLTGGKRIGQLAELNEIKDKQIMITINGEEFEAARRHAFVVPKEFSLKK
jgi:small subunit ribosomal protein S4e